MSNHEFVKAIQRDPLVLGDRLWPDRTLWQKQREIITAVWKHKRVAVRSGNGVGKTYTAANLALLFLYAWPNSKVITTAPTWKQVEKILWAEINELYALSKYPLGGEIINTELTIGPEWRAFGLSTNKAVNFQGHHNEHILVIMDEASGVSNEIDRATRSLLTSQHSRILKIGNPYETSGHFYDCFHSHAELWHKLKISCYDSPNITSGKLIYPGLVTQEWIDDQIKEYGSDSPWVECFVKGEFPKQGEDVLINLEWVVKAMQREDVSTQGSEAIGCDVARFGDDETIIAQKKGHVFSLEDIRKGQDTMETAGKLKIRAVNGVVIGVDDAGVGGGVTDRLTEQEIKVVPFMAGGKAHDPERFSNATAEAWWIFRELLRTEPIGLPNDDKLMAQLVGRKFKFNSKGQIVLESKEDMKKRGLKSPDRADAVIIANYTAVYGEPKNPWDELLKLEY